VYLPYCMKTTISHPVPRSGSCFLRHTSEPRPTSSALQFILPSGIPCVTQTISFDIPYYNQIVYVCLFCTHPLCVSLRSQQVQHRARKPGHLLLLVSLNPSEPPLNPHLFQSSQLVLRHHVPVNPCQRA